MSANVNETTWPGRWLCPKCLRIYKRPAQIIDGRAYHSWRCGNNPMRRVDVTITPAETTEAGQ